MSIRRKGQAVLAGEEKVSFEIGRGHYALGKELNIFSAQAIVGIFLEMGNSRL